MDIVDELSKLIQEYPKIIATIFAITNAMWALFVLFHNKKHDKELKKLQHSLDLDLEQRKVAYTLKVKQYENYANMIDNFGKKYQTELMEKMLPIVSDFMLGIQRDVSDQNKINNLSSIFIQKSLLLNNEINQEYMKIKSQTSSLKLIASDNLLKVFNRLEKHIEYSMKISNIFISEAGNYILHNKMDEIEKFQNEINSVSTLIQEQSEFLKKVMRDELKNI